MEAIAEINDLACSSIELGDYHISLDVLNSCLGCVKQLKRFRAPNSESSSIDDKINTAIKATIARTLKAAKEKLISSPRVVVKKREAYKASVAITRPQKRRRQPSQGDLEFHTNVVPSSEVSTTTSVKNDVAPSRSSSSVIPSFSESKATSSPKRRTCSSDGDNPRQHFLQDRFYSENQDTEERYFIYRKPIRLSKLQWSRIAECCCQERRQRDPKHQVQILREVELAVSANLIFNIALSHHMIATSTKSELAWNYRHNLRLSPDSSDETGDSDDDDDSSDSGSGYGITGIAEDMSFADSLQTKQRLKGALRLYELGFRVHTKRVAVGMSSKIHLSRRGQLHSSYSSIPFATTSLPTAALSPNEPGARRPSEDRSQGSHSDRDDELKSTTRFSLALLNNCAQIYHALGESEKALVFQKRLLSFLLVVVDSGESIHDIIGDEPAVEGYLKNVLAGTVFNKDTAPAAMA